MGRRILFLAFITVIGNLTLAQKVESLYENAEDFFYEEQFISALKAYREVEKINKNFADLDYKILICSLLVDKNYSDVASLEAYENIMLPPGKPPVDKFFNYWLGRVYLEKVRFIEAEETLNKFLKGDYYKSDEILAEAKKWIRFAQLGQEYYESSNFYQIYHLGSEVNSEADEVSPVYFDDNHELLFLSNRGDNRNNYYIYHSYLKDDRRWSEPSVIENLGVFDEVGATIEVVSADGRLFQYNNAKKGGLYYSESDGAKHTWTNPVLFDADFSHTDLSSHFYINETENRIIFSKNVGTRKNPNLDLFESYLDPETKVWSDPVPFPENINTLKNEDSPYLSQNEKVLYFSSDGHETFGGYDIFKSTYIEIAKKWGDPESMRFPINTLDDETQFKMNADQKSGYFTSNRVNTYGRMDIFFFWHADMIELSGTVIGLDSVPMHEARLYFRPKEYLDMYYYAELDENGQFYAEIPSDGSFDVEIRTDNGVYSEEFELHAPGTLKLTFIKDFFISEKSKRVKAPQKIYSEEKTQQVVQNSKSNKETEVKNLGNKFRSSNTARLKNIYFDANQTGFTDESLPSLNQLKEVLEGNPNMKIEISGHTDNIGSTSNNLRISELRANAVKNWLVKNGINAERIQTIGYGESRPLASNDDEKDGRELNRRIEIRVL